MAHWRRVLPGGRHARGALRGPGGGFRALGAPDRRVLRARVGRRLPRLPRDQAPRAHREREPGPPADLQELGRPLGRLQGSAGSAHQGAAARGAAAPEDGLTRPAAFRIDA